MPSPPVVSLLLIADTHLPHRARNLPATVWAAVDQVDVVVHETGPATRREARCAGQFHDVDVLVFGHSHIPWDTTTSSGLRLLNPGSPTDRRRQPHCSFMTAIAAHGELRDVVLHRVPHRSA